MSGFFNFGRVKQIVEEACGLEITHVHEDLVFIENSAFMLQFDLVDLEHFKVFFNPECPKEDRDQLFYKLSSAAPRNGMRCTLDGTFEMVPVADKEEFTLTFHPLTEV